MGRAALIRSPRQVDQNPLTSTAYNGFGDATSVNFGSLDSDNFAYDYTGSCGQTVAFLTQYTYDAQGNLVGY
jgi:hypothetical protein